MSIYLRFSLKIFSQDVLCPLSSSSLPRPFSLDIYVFSRFRFSSSLQRIFFLSIDGRAFHLDEHFLFI
jgi:hypothetical protein